MNDKDQAAIDHVASVSKHPHAAMIVKWLITGWDAEVKIGNTWQHAINPAWTAGYEYRLIEPRTAKPEYRVYIEPTNGHPAIARRSVYDINHNSFKGKVEWLTDWIEYDQPKKWPTPLVERIAAIDLEAAQWIVDHWDELLEGDYSCCGSYSRDSEKLYNMFFWDHSQQKDEYWRKIAEQLAE